MSGNGGLDRLRSKGESDAPPAEAVPAAATPARPAKAPPPAPPAAAAAPAPKAPPPAPAAAPAPPPAAAPTPPPAAAATAAATPDASTTPTDRIKLSDILASDAKASAAAQPAKTAGARAPLPARAPAATQAPPEGEESGALKRRVLEHTARLRRAFVEGQKPAEPPPRAPAPRAPAPAPAPKAPEPPTSKAPERAAPPAPAPVAADSLAADPTRANPDDTAALRRAIADNTKKTTLHDLEKKGVKNVAVLDMKTIERIVADAVEKALESRSRHLTGTARKQLEHDARREFFDLLEEHKRTVTAKTDEERRRIDLEKQVERLRSSVAAQEEALEEQRTRAGVTIAPESLDELETRIETLLEGFMTLERRALLADPDDEKRKRALDGLDRLEKQLGEAFDRLVGRLKSDYEGLLERRIEKLNKALSETEDALRRVASMKMIDDGVASIYGSVQGLDLGALNFERKKELLAVVFLENLELQGKQVTEADRQSAVVVSPITHRPGDEIRTADDMDFHKPLDPINTETAF